MANAELWQQRGVWEKRHDKPYIHKQLWSHAGVGQSKSCVLCLLDCPIPWCQYSPSTQHCPISKYPSKRRRGIFLLWPCWVLTCSRTQPALCKHTLLSENMKENGWGNAFCKCTKHVIAFGIWGTREAKIKGLPTFQYRVYKSHRLGLGSMITNNKYIFWIFYSMPISLLWICQINPALCCWRCFSHPCVSAKSCQPVFRGALPQGLQLTPQWF